MEKPSHEQRWTEIYLAAKAKGNVRLKKKAERSLIELGVIDDPIAEEALIESYA